MNSIVHMQSSDHEWLYLNGEFFADGHRISSEAWFVLGQICTGMSYQLIKHYTVNEEYIEENGDLPFEFNEIPEVVLNGTE